MSGKRPEGTLGGDGHTGSIQLRLVRCTGLDVELVGCKTEIPLSPPTFTCRQFITWLFDARKPTLPFLWKTCHLISHNYPVQYLT